MDFPIINISRFDSDFVCVSKTIFKASQEWGFFIVTDHGIEGASGMFELSRNFFNLPMETKCEKVINEDPVGYDGHRATTFAASEGMSFGLPGNQLTKSTNIHSWWDTAKIEEIESFKSQCNSLTLKILSCFATHMDLPGGFFDASHRQVLPGNTLKFIKYPKMTTKPDVIPRLSEHTDWGSLTLLFTESPGLEVRDPNNQWHDVPVVPGGVIINIGDALSLWTGKQLKSTMHRISWEKVPMHQDRYSMPYFVHPNFTANLRSLSAPYDSDATQLTYKDYFDVRLRLTYGRIGAHTNFDAITILLQDTTGGLQVWNNLTSTWVNVTPIPGAGARRTPKRLQLPGPQQTRLQIRHHILGGVAVRFAVMQADIRVGVRVAAAQPVDGFLGCVERLP
ncbi:hypothetical protein AtubIFM56815_009512 [Aspergillus tubingensis]|uniref:Fe2OG dioxygenase domain-containing protein n=1 Tax=Aspergillus tubingensis TaxID=5068 RepID=A0A9W6AMB7_ASPTU|nr:hypothetical protein AtubIFM56815_009512 [Aspergillus tubingensis]GLB00732.1 hypothetical protein AtubIFM57143_009785 [Aspergillus tubingensis]